MKLKDLRDAMERMKDFDGEREIVYSCEPQSVNGEIGWANKEVRAVFSEEHIPNSPIMLLSPECSDTLRDIIANKLPPGHEVHIEANRDTGFVGYHVKPPEEG